MGGGGGGGGGGGSYYPSTHLCQWTTQGHLSDQWNQGGQPKFEMSSITVCVETGEDDHIVGPV